MKTCNDCCTVFWNKLGNHCPVCNEATIMTDVELPISPSDQKLKGKRDTCPACLGYGAHLIVDREEICDYCEGSGQS